MRLEPTNIQQIGGELAISWNDGSESFFKLETLRRACPCAACGGEPDVLGHIARPSVTYTDESFRLASFDLIGGYALQPRWGDGHSPGIYSFTYLRRLTEAPDLKCAIKLKRFMPLTLKVAIVFLCFSFCWGGTLISS